MYCCEDHFDPIEDLKNYFKHKLMQAEPVFKPTAKLRYLLVSKDKPQIVQSELLRLLHSVARALESRSRKKASVTADEVSDCNTSSKIEVSIQLTQMPEDEVSPPTRLVPEDSRSVTPITDPEDEEEAEFSLPIKEEKDYTAVVQDPLSQGSSQGSFKQLHSHPGVDHSQLYVQPSTSTSELVIKEEIDEDMMDYRSMYYKLLDELAELKNQQHDQEKQALIETNKSLGKEMENLIATNTKYVNDMQNLMNENQRLKEKNQGLAENIRHLSDKIQELTAKNEENQTKERVEIFDDYIEKIERLNEKIRSLAEDNKSLIESNKSLAESVRKYLEECRNFEMQNKKQRKFIKRLNNNCYNKLETKSKVIKALRHDVFRLKAANARLKRPHVAVQS